MEKPIPTRIDKETDPQGSDLEYRVIFETALDGMEIIDAETGRIVLANQAAAKIFGFGSPEEMTGVNPLDCIPMQDRERISHMIAENMFEKDLHEVMELRAVTREGKQIWLSALGVRTEHRGKLAGLVSFRDITTHKLMKEQLRASAEQNRLLIENASEGIGVIQDGMVEFINHSLLELTKYSEQEMRSRPFIEFVHPDDQQMAAEHHVKRLGGENVPHTCSFRIIDRNGHTKWLEVNAVPFAWEGRPAILDFVNDITERKAAEDALRESEKRYRLLADNVSDVIWVTDLNLRLTYTSPSIRHLLGYSVEEAMALKFEEVLTPASAEVGRNALAVALATRKEDLLAPQTLEIEMKRKDGSTVWAESTHRFVWGQDGQPFEVLGVLREITERKQAEEALRDSERRYRLLADNVSDVIWVTDLNLRPAYVSPSVTRLLGYSTEEVFSLTVEGVLTPVSFEAAQTALSRAMVLEKESHGQLSESFPLLEVEMVHKDGSTVWTESTLSFIYDSGDRPVAIMGVLRDIRERKKAEKALRESEVRFRNLVEATSDWVWEVDRDGVYSYVSPKVSDILGYEDKEVLGKTPFDFMPPEEARRVAKLFGSIVAEERPFVFLENTALHKDGHAVILETNGVPFFDHDGALLGYRGIDRDISERKQVAGLLEESIRKIERTVEASIQSISYTMETRDPYTAGHQRRVTQLACAIGREMGLSDTQIAGIRVAGLVHDIGKISVPTEILSKPGPLTGVEMAMIKAHPKVGYDILKNIEFQWPVAWTTLQHHERMDGSGYPSGISGNEILLEARILAVSDVVEAMSSHRPYRPALGIDKALDEISRGGGTLYDPDVVHACLMAFAKSGFMFEE